jgi:hypothetical protein
MILIIIPCKHFFFFDVWPYVIYISGLEREDFMPTLVL